MLPISRNCAVLSLNKKMDTKKLEKRGQKMDADRRGWSFMQWADHFRSTSWRVLKREITETRTIDLNHPVTGFAEPWMDHCTVFGVLCSVHSGLVALIVASRADLIDWSATAVKCRGYWEGEDTHIVGTAAAVLFDGGCLIPSVFRYFDPCSVAKTIPGVYEYCALECYIENACKCAEAGLVTSALFQQLDALPMSVLHLLNVHAYNQWRLQQRGTLENPVASEVADHIEWRESNAARQHAVLWLGGDAASSKDVLPELWRGQGLGSAIAARMQYSYKQYTEEEDEQHNNGSKNKKIKMDTE